MSEGFKSLDELLKDNWSKIEGESFADYVILKKGNERIIYDDIRKRILVEYNIQTNKPKTGEKC
jgi:hypothetical protein